MQSAAGPGPMSGTDRGVSSVLGYALVFALVAGGMTTVVVLGATSVSDTQSQSELERAEHSMTLLDSRAAMVALGEANGQTLSFGQDSGRFYVNESAGFINITHRNYSDANDPDAKTEVIYNETLGAVVYENGQQTMVYQGGGVWQRNKQGQAQMVSPPEFHYRSATLTLPVIRTRGTGSGSGSVEVGITPLEQARLVYPNATASSPDGTGAPYDLSDRNYTNPVKNGSVNVTVQSRYYRAWATYFEERTEGEVTVWDSNTTVKLQLASIGGPTGEFDLPPAGDTVPANAIGDGHPITDFELSLDIDKNKPHYSLYGMNDSREIEVHVYADGNPSCPDPDTPVHVSVYYYDGDGSKTYEAWEMASSVNPENNPDSAMKWTCDGGDPQLYVNLVSSDIDMYYDAVGSGGTENPNIDDPGCGSSTGTTRGNKYAFHDHMEDCDSEGWQQRDPTTWDQHPSVSSPSESGSGTDFTPGDGPVALKAVTNHYLSMMGQELDLVSKHGPGTSTPIDTSNSYGELSYQPSPGAEFVTYLHITENEIEVDFD